jgi:hypothetical protein
MSTDDMTAESARRLLKLKMQRQLELTESEAIAEMLVSFEHLRNGSRRRATSRSPRARSSSSATWPGHD